MNHKNLRARLKPNVTRRGAPQPEHDVWTCELPIALETWKRTANSDGVRVNTKRYRAHKQLIQGYLTLGGCPNWDSAPVKLELHVYTTSSRADWDNFGKVISDALQGYLYIDDNQVLDGRVIKHLVDTRCAQRATLRVWRLDPETPLHELSEEPDE